MNYIQFGLLSVLILNFGCVHRTAQWVAEKTVPKDVNTSDVSSSTSEATGSDGDVLYNDKSKRAWRVLFWIGGFIVLCCTVPLLYTENNKKRLSRWRDSTKAYLQESRLKLLALLRKFKKPK